MVGGNSASRHFAITGHYIVRENSASRHFAITGHFMVGGNSESRHFAITGHYMVGGNSESRHFAITGHYMVGGNSDSRHLVITEHYMVGENSNSQQLAIRRSLGQVSVHILPTTLHTRMVCLRGGCVYFSCKIRFRYASTKAVKLGGTTVVALNSTMTAGPSIRLPGLRDSR